MPAGRWASPGPTPGSSEPLQAQHPAGQGRCSCPGAALCSSPPKPSQMHQQHSEYEALSQSPLHSPCLAAGKISWHCHILLFVYINLWEPSRLRRGHPRGTGRSTCLCVCTVRETQLAGHGRCRDFQSFPVLSHTLSMAVQETKKLSSLLSYFSSSVTLATVSKCNAHDILLLP